MLRYVAIVFVF